MTHQLKCEVCGVVCTDGKCFSCSISWCNSPVDGECYRCKKKYEVNSAIFPIKAGLFLKLWKGDPNFITLQDANDLLEQAKNDIKKYTVENEDYCTFHPKCWKIMKDNIWKIYSKIKSDSAFGRGLDIITSSDQFNYDETDDFMSRHKGTEDRVIDR